MSQVKDKWLCLEILCLKLQISSTKLQINFKFKYSMTKTLRTSPACSGIEFSNFGHWDLFDIWDLIFGISVNQ